MTKSCLAPHEIQAGDLVAYLEGVAPPQVVKHIDQCPACSSEVAALRQIDSLLTGAFAQARSPMVDHRPASHSNGSKLKPQADISGFKERQLAQTMMGRQISPSRMALVAFGQLLILLGLLSSVYYFFQYPPGRLVDMTPQASETTVIATSTTGKLNLPLPDEAAQINSKLDTGVVDTSQQTEAITEKVSAIAPPRYILKKIEEELQADSGHLLVYYLEEASAIMPPRRLLRMLEEELQPQHNRLLSHRPDDSEPYWSESVVLDPYKGDAYIVRLTVQRRTSIISFARSTDDGQTWGEEVPIYRKRSSLFNPSLATDAQGNLYVVWREGRNLGANIYFAHSSDGGQTWSRGTRLNNEPGQNFKPSLAVGDEGALYITWQNPRNNNTNIYFIRSNDGGQTWSPETRIAKVGS